ncbi:MAG: hypothetical protein U7123_22145 [Potamolinea sp.]
MKPHSPTRDIISSPWLKPYCLKSMLDTGLTEFLAINKQDFAGLASALSPQGNNCEAVPRREAPLRSLR